MIKPTAPVMISCGQHLLQHLRPALTASTSSRQREPEECKLEFNSEYRFNDAAEFYTFGGYSKRRGETAAFCRASNASNNNRAIYWLPA